MLASAIFDFLGAICSVSARKRFVAPLGKFRITWMLRIMRDSLEYH
jgi:hypothetical protein